MLRDANVNLILPAAARLQFDCDPGMLATELQHVADRVWLPKNSFRQDAPAEADSEAWQAIAIRSQGGDPARTDPGGPGLLRFAPTPIAGELPYLQQLVGMIPAEVRSARLLALAPGASSPVHRDDVGWDRGLVRLHVPLSTNHAAEVWIDGNSYYWDVGELWYGDFGRDHYVANNGSSGRVHLVIDALLSTELLQLFPDDYRAVFPYGDATFARQAIPLGPRELTTFRSAFRVPRPDYIFEHNAWERAEPENCEAEIDVVDASLVLSFRPGGQYALVHLGASEFRIEGWTDIHTVRIVRGQPEPVISFVYRRSRDYREYRMRGTYLD
jgi:hypothetical protein